jgi:hypothetical protein
MPAIHTRNAREPSPSHRRLLRVGIIHGKRIVEERLVSATSAVTIGTSPRATFIIPWDGVPHRWRLFEQRGGRRTLRLAPGMSARIARPSGGNVTSFDSDASAPIPLPDDARGKITVGDTTVLFQLLRPPAPQPRPRLPFSLQRRALDGIERGFVAVLAATLALHVAVVVYLRQVEWPRRPAIEEVPDRFVSNIVRTPRPAPPAAPAATTAARTTPAPSSARRPHTAPPASSPPSRSPAIAAGPSRESLEAQVRNSGLISVITARSADGTSPIADVLAAGGVDRPMDEAFKNIGGLGIAGLDPLPGLTPSGGHGKVGTVDTLRIGSRIAQPTTTGPAGGERSVASRVVVAPPVLESGKADLDAIVRDIRGRRKAIAACYERALKSNPALAGKLVVRFSIASAGTVVAVAVDEDTLGAPDVAGCVRGLIARWRFAPPADAPVEVSFPFVFQAGS